MWLIHLKQLCQRSLRVNCLSSKSLQQLLFQNNGPWQASTRPQNHVVAGRQVIVLLHWWKYRYLLLPGEHDALISLSAPSLFSQFILCLPPAILFLSTPTPSSKETPESTAHPSDLDPEINDPVNPCWATFNLSLVSFYHLGRKKAFMGPGHSMPNTQGQKSWHIIWLHNLILYLVNLKTCYLDQSVPQRHWKPAWLKWILQLKAQNNQSFTLWWELVFFGSTRSFSA